MERVPIALLPAEVSRRIAAGEVIEKPASVVRELLDNALDAAANEIDITWDEGGIESIRVRDDGLGMTPDDLELCWKPHATSKIRTVEDLDRTRSLGFRGEALASMAAVSELTIESTARDPSERPPAGRRIDVRYAQLVGTAAAPPRPGTSVTVRRLFSNLPARRRFLSRSQAESRAIRNTILEKALPFPAVRFTFPGTGSTQRVLPEQTLVERTAEVFGRACPVQSLTKLHGTGEGFSCTIIAAHPEIIRRDRRLISVYVNRRRVSEFKLVQAVEYAYQDVQHGGVFPVAAVLIDVEPDRVDFNIHPAKREVRLRNIGEIHHRIVTILRTHLHAYAVRAVSWEPNLWEAAERPASDGVAERRAHRDERGAGRAIAGTGRANTGARRATSGTGPAPSFEHTRRAVPDGETLRFHGTVFGTFNLIERGDKLYIIDQHAVHERLLYDRLAADRTPQSLLVPEEFETTSDQDHLLKEHAGEYRDLGIALERVAEGKWRLTAVPAVYRYRAEALIETILELGGLNEAYDRDVLAEIACKAAIKAGDYLDGLTGEDLARHALALAEPRCPHGRPLWIELDRNRLESLIGRR